MDLIDLEGYHELSNARSKSNVSCGNRQNVRSLEKMHGATRLDPKRPK